jgi:hypothetical protein
MFISQVALELPAAPVARLSPCKRPFDVPVQCPEHADASEHGRAAKGGYQDQGFHYRLPFGGLVVGFRKARRPRASRAGAHGAAVLARQTLASNPGQSPLVIALNVNLEIAQQPRRGEFIAHVAVRTRHPSASALAGVLAFPRPTQMILAYPAAVIAEGTRRHNAAPVIGLATEVWVNLAKGQ